MQSKLYLNLLLRNCLLIYLLFLCNFTFAKYIFVATAPPVMKKLKFKEVVEVLVSLQIPANVVGIIKVCNVAENDMLD